MSKSYVTESPNLLYTSLNDFVLKQEDLLGELIKMKNAINDNLAPMKAKSNKLERVKLDHTTVVGKFKECDGKFNKLDDFVSELERSYASSLLLHKESPMACRILKLVQKPKENNRQQYIELHEDVTSLP